MKLRFQAPFSYCIHVCMPVPSLIKCQSQPSLSTALRVAWLLRIAAHNLDLIGLNIVLVVELEINILDQKSPNIIAEAICIEVSLCKVSSAKGLPELYRQRYLEVQARLHLFCEHFCDGFVKCSNDLHGSLRLDATRVDEFVQGVDQGHADAAESALVSLPMGRLTVGQTVPATTIQLIV